MVCRTIKLNAENFIPEDIILELENKSSKDCDVNIQYILPSMMEYNGLIKNVGLFACETDYFDNSNWVDQLNLMDDVLVINKEMYHSCIKSGVNKYPKIVGHPIDLKKCHSKHGIYNLNCPKESFKFLFIGESTRRKNLTALIKAFHLEFDCDEQVELVIKTSSHGISPLECYNKTVLFCNEIKKGLKLYNDISGYKKEIIISDRISEEQISDLHNSCDAFCCTSYGEAWSIPAMESLAMGKPLIVTNYIGTSSFLNNDVAWLVESHKEPVFGMIDGTFNDLYVANENWRSIDIDGLRLAMREVFNNKELRDKKTENAIDFSLNFSYDKVGKKILGAIGA